MNREIKFRFWTPDKFMMSDHKGWVEDIGINEAIEASKQYGYKIMQFTGLLDKNSKEIYTKDILSEKWKAEVYQCENTGAFMVKFHNNPTFNKPKTLFDYLNSRKQAGAEDVDCVVIGNIYANPELLNP